MTPLFTSRNPQAAALARALARLAPTELTVLLEGETGVGKTFVAARLHRRGRPAGRSSWSTAVPYPRLFWRRNCSATGRGPSPTRLACGLGHASAPATGPWSSTASTHSRLRPRPCCCGCSRSGGSYRSADQRRGRCAPGRRSPALTCSRAWPGRNSARTCSTGSAAITPCCRRSASVQRTSSRSADRWSRRAGAGRLRLEPEAETWLQAYPWPGNFRELRMALERSCLLADGPVLGVAEIGLPAGGWEAVQGEALARTRTLAEVGRLSVLAVLAREGGNVSRAARLLG